VFSAAVAGKMTVVKYLIEECCASINAKIQNFQASVELANLGRHKDIAGYDTP